MYSPPTAGRLAAMNPRSLAAITAVGLALLAAACGSSPSSTGSGGSPNVGGSGGPPNAGASANSSALVAYSQCMRSHGIPNFPDPDSSGGIPKDAVISADRAVSNSQVQTASSACEHLLPPGQSLSGKPIQTITTQQQQDYLKAAACMRSHGIINFPEPTFQNGQVEFPNLAQIVDTHSTQFTQAEQVCRKLIPPGLPDSGSGDGNGG
jgi:hypothetical protein